MAGVMGVGSGIDIGSIVKALVDAEKAPKTLQLNRLEAATTERFSGLGSLKSALSSFQSAVKGLNQTSLFEARTASSSLSSVLTASASTTAAAGKYSIQVQQLAASSKVALQSVSGGSATTFNSGTLTITGGTASVEVDVTAANNSLTGIRDAINTAGQSKGISASIVTDASGSRLLLSSTKAGAGNDIQVSVTQDGVTTGANALTTQAFTPTVDPGNPDAFVAPNSTAGNGAGGVITKAQSAKLTVDGLQIVSTTNTVTGAIDGVTLNLVSAQSSADLLAGKTADVTVGVDKAGVKTNLQKFVDAYNKLISTTSQLTSVVQVGEGKEPVTGPLVGDASVRGLLSGVRNELVKLTGEGGVRALADLGITTQKDGTLKLDDSKLTTALNNDFDKVASYLTGETGLMGRLDKSIDGFSKTGGVLDQRIKGLETTLSGIDKQRATLDLRIAKVQERLVAQYTAMDQLVGRLQKTSESLAGQLASLPGFVKKNN